MLSSKKIICSSFIQILTFHSDEKKIVFHTFENNLGSHSARYFFMQSYNLVVQRKLKSCKLDAPKSSIPKEQALMTFYPDPCRETSRSHLRNISTSRCIEICTAGVNFFIFVVKLNNTVDLLVSRDLIPASKNLQK